jgi:antitoxin (DNA-binding transcriptional repressor) of toxin-antitoxin stability system
MMAMSTHSVAEAESHLSSLIDRALEGETVVITRDGDPVAEIKPVRANTRAAREAELAWLDAHRVKLPAGVDVQAILRQMRDEE